MRFRVQHHQHPKMRSRKRDEASLEAVVASCATAKRGTFDVLGRLQLLREGDEVGLLACGVRFTY